MNLPVPFLLGLAVLMIHDQLVDYLPGEATIGQLAPFLIGLVIPATLANWNGSRLRRIAVSGKRASVGLRTSMRLQGLAVPAVFWILVSEGGLANLVEVFAPGSSLLQLTLLMAPLIGMELSQKIVERRTLRWLEWRGLEPDFVIPSGQLSMALFLLVPIVLLAVGSEIALKDRRAEVFFRATAVGGTLGVLIVVAVLCLTLPLIFRWVLPVQSRLPPHLDGTVRETVAQLGFPASCVVAMRTGLRMVNAALVGPLPWPRYLVLTDGILTILDRYSLRGVVAHEIGHAHAGHPGWLLLVFVVLPVMLIHPLGLIDYGGLETWSLIGIGGSLLVIAVLGLRTMSRRFEFEADQLSADALGGAAPCIAALRRVGDMFAGHRGRGSFRHPSEEQRVQNLLALEVDAGYRAAFQRRGSRLRTAIIAVLVCAFGISSWAHVRSWSVDRAVYLHYSGDFRGAREQLDELPQDPVGISERQLRELEEEVDAAIALVGEGGSWEEIRDGLAERAWARGLEVLGSGGPTAARPLFSLALSRAVSSPLERTMYLYCAAASDEDDERQTVLRSHLERLGAPPTILALLARR